MRPSVLRHYFLSPLLFFANPAALWALLGLLVPLAIHLWNRRPGRVVPVGALRWLTAGANRRMRRLHLTQWPLLLLRLAVVAVLAAALLGPRWQQPARPARPQVLVSPEVLTSAAWPLLRTTVDSLRRRGAELRLFAPGFPRLTDSVADQKQRRVLTPDSATTTDWSWARAAEAADRFPAQPLYLFTSASLAHFAGSRPVLPARLHWQLLPPDSATRSWLQAAARPTADSLWLTIGRSDAGGGVSFRRQRLAWPTQLPQQLTVQGLSSWHLQPRGTGFAIQSADSAGVAVPIARPLRVGVGYDSTRRADLRYVQAALRAAAPALPAGLSLRTHPVALATAFATDSLDWLLWLTDAPLPAALQRQVPRGLHVLHDAPAPGRTTPTAVAFAFDDLSDASRLLRRSTAPAGTTPRWTDATGQPALSWHPTGRGAELYLHTRFHPKWSTLPDDGQLPTLLLMLLDPAAPARPEVRSLDARQLAAGTAAPVPPAAPAAVPASRDLRPWLILAAGLLFGFERVLASRRLSRSAA